MDVLDNLKSLERQSEDRIWRTAKAAGEEINRLRSGVAAYLKANDTEGFGCACTPKFKCYPCREHDRQKPLRELLTPNVELTGGAPGIDNEEPLPERRPVERFVGGDDK